MQTRHLKNKVLTPLHYLSNIHLLTLGHLSYFCHCGPSWGGGELKGTPLSYFYIIDHRSINLVCCVGLIIIYVLGVTNMVAWLNFWTHLQKPEEKGHAIYNFYKIDHRQTKLVCICRSTTPLINTSILPNIQLIQLPYNVNFMGKWGKMYLPKLITESQIMYACMYMSTSAIIPNIQLIWLPWQHFLLN